MVDSKREKDKEGQSSMPEEEYTCRKCNGSVSLREGSLCFYCRQIQFIDYDLYNYSVDFISIAWKRELHLN